MGYTKDINSQIGKKFNRLTILSIAEPHIRKDGYKNNRVNVICECGTEKTVSFTLVNKGNIKSCGCMQLESIKSSNEHPNYKHGLSNANKKSPEYASWLNMRNRCNNANCDRYHRYGGRGITVCERWNDYSLFIKDMGNRPSKIHTIERIDNDGNYEPSNCKWATRAEQNTNKSNVELFEYKGEKQTLKYFANKYEQDYSSLRSRILRSGLTIDQALTYVWKGKKWQPIS